MRVVSAIELSRQLPQVPSPVQAATVSIVAGGWLILWYVRDPHVDQLAARIAAQYGSALNDLPHKLYQVAKCQPSGAVAFDLPFFKSKLPKMQPPYYLGDERDIFTAWIDNVVATKNKSHSSAAVTQFASQPSDFRPNHHSG